MYLLEFVGTDDRFAAYEAATAANDVSRLAPGLGTARGIDADRMRALAYTHRVSELIGHTTGGVDDARRLLEAASIDRAGSVAVRVTTPRGSSSVSTSEAERELGQVLVDRGFTVDLETPDHVLRVSFSENVCALGWLVVDVDRDFTTRAPTNKPFFQPGSMDPDLARALANVAGAAPGARILDPMCGTGGVLVEAGLAGADVVGIDAQTKMARGAHTNLAHYLETPAHVVRGDATRIPLCDDAVTGVVFDAPYGRQSRVVNARLDDLVRDALEESARVATGTVVAVGDRSWADVAEDVGFTVDATFEKRVHRSLTRTIVVASQSYFVTNGNSARNRPR